MQHIKTRSLSGWYMNANHVPSHSLWVFLTSISWWSLMGAWVTASLHGYQDSSEYSSWSYQYCGLDGLDSFSDFWFLQSFFQAFGDCSKCTDCNWYCYHPLVPQAFHFSGQVCWNNKFYNYKLNWKLLYSLRKF